MKKNLKKITAVLMCAWNLYMPNSIQDDRELQMHTNAPIVEEIIIEESNEDIEEEIKKGKVKYILSFLPSIF